MDLRARLQQLPGHIAVNDGDSEDYDTLQFVTYVGEGQPGVTPEMFPFGQEADELAEAIRQLQAEVGPEVTLPPGLIGIVDPAALVSYIYLPEEAAKWLPVYRTAIVQAVNAGCRTTGMQAQLESPYALISVLTASEDDLDQVVEARAQEIADTVNALEMPVRLHLCYGDFGGKSWLGSLGIPGIDLRRLVLLVNAIHDKCGDKVLSYLLPMAAGEIPPSTDPAFYAPLRDINPKARVVVGLIRPEVDTATNITAVGLALEALACEVLGVSLPCGAGRLDAEKLRMVIAILQACLRHFQ